MCRGSDNKKIAIFFFNEESKIIQQSPNHSHKSIGLDEKIAIKVVKHVFDKET